MKKKKMKLMIHFTPPQTKILINYRLSEDERANSDNFNQDFNTPEGTEILSSALQYLPNETQPRRRKRRSSELWKQNIRKQKRNSGQPYINCKNKEIQARGPTPACNNNCRYKCSNLIDPETRQIICLDFWKLGNIQQQRNYIMARVNVHESVRTRVEQSRRLFTQEYYLIYLNQKYRVCKKFFLCTLNISEKMLRTTVSKADHSIANIPSPDHRGKHPPGISLHENILALTEEHINSFPTVPAH